MDMTSPDQVNNITSGTHDVKDYLEKNNMKKSGTDLGRKVNNYSRHQNTLYQISKISSAKND